MDNLKDTWWVMKSEQLKAHLLGNMTVEKLAGLMV
jgi:hypothetical protein